MPLIVIMVYVISRVLLSLSVYSNQKIVLCYQLFLLKLFFFHGKWSSLQLSIFFILCNHPQPYHLDMWVYYLQQKVARYYAEMCDLIQFYFNISQ